MTAMQNFLSFPISIFVKTWTKRPLEIGWFERNYGITTSMYFVISA